MINLSPESKDYLEQFDYGITVRLGKSYTRDFKEFYAWCEAHLGVKYRDWFMVSVGPDVYLLKCRNNKWAMFLTLTWVDLIA